MDVTSISAVIASISVIAAVIFAIFQMRDAAKTRHTGLIIKLNPALNVTMKELIESVSKILNMEFKDYEDYQEKYGDPKSDTAVHTITGYSDGLGYLLYKGLIDVETIEYILSGSTKSIWEKLKPVIEGRRKHYNLPELSKWFEYLYKEMQKRE